MGGVRTKFKDPKAIAAELKKRINLPQIGDEVTELARDLAPVDTGNLKRSIHAEVVSGGGASMAAAVGGAGTPGPGGSGQAVKISTRCGYGAYVELGTRRAAAQPFLAPAVQQVAQRIARATFKQIVDGNF